MDATRRPTEASACPTAAVTADSSLGSAGSAAMATGRVRDRDDACPGAIEASTGDDGLIARVRLPGGRLTAHQARELAACADQLGRGFVDLTVRANAQLRGLDDGGVRALAPRLATAGLLPSPAHDRARNILAGPFAGRDRAALVDAARIVRELDAGLCADPELAGLPGRFQFAVDDGALPIATHRHDVALVAVAPGTVALHVAGTDTGLRGHSPEAAARLALTAARAFMRIRKLSGAWHVRELPGGPAQLAIAVSENADLAGAAAVGAAAAGAGRLDPAASPHVAGRPVPQADEAGTPTARHSGPVIGVVPQSDGRVAVSAVVPLGRLTGEQLRVLAETVAAAPAPSETESHTPASCAPASDEARIRIAPWRGVVVTDLAPEAAEEVVAALAATGLAFTADSAWLRVTACSGLDECRRARTDIRDTARQFAMRARPSMPVHFAACGRACGRPAGAALVVALDGDTKGDSGSDTASQGSYRAGHTSHAARTDFVEPCATQPTYAVSADNESGAAWTGLITSLRPIVGPLTLASDSVADADADSVANADADADSDADSGNRAGPESAPRPHPHPHPPERHSWTTG